MPEYRSLMHNGWAENLDAYFAALQSSGGVPPAWRFRLEGYLQGLLSVAAIREHELRDGIAQRIESFNARGNVVLQPEREAWRLPYRAPLAPVHPSASN
ncbi:MAG: hypothetical protein WBN40_03970 [Pseudomonadales bacterium]